MRWRVPLVVSAVTVAVLGIATPAVAKGPDQATITGPGLATPIVVDGNGEPGSSEALGKLSMGSGLFRYMFHTEDGSGTSLTAAPGGNLGPKFALDFRVPDGSTTPSTFHQDLYPAAPGGPVTFTPAGQTVFGTASDGGWFRPSPDFGKVLAEIGVAGGAPASALAAIAPATQAAAPPVDHSGWPAAWLLGLTVGLGAVVALALAGLIVIRFRHRTAPA